MTGDALRNMLGRYSLVTAEDAENALREIVQNITLFGLWKARFFDSAAFYGGSALRILYGLDRFSEDMDFSLLRADPGFSFEPYRGELVRTLNIFGFSAEFVPRPHVSAGNILSAFLKTNTSIQLASIGVPELPGISRGRILKVKIEVDIAPPGRFETELRPVLEPTLFQPRVLGLPWLFAGKMHAVLCRAWGDRVKGRDWYDMIWYLRRKTPVDLPHLEERMRQTGHWKDESFLTPAAFLRLYESVARSLDVRAAISEVAPFLKNPENLSSVWSNELFAQLGEAFCFRPGNAGSV